MKTTEGCKQVRLIATDMDGTLLNEHHRVSEENAAAIKEAQRRGITVVVATGRSYAEAVHPLKEAGITCPIICVNGAEIRSEHGEKIKSVPLNPATYWKVESILREAGLYFELYTNIGVFTNDREKALRTVADFVRSAYPDADEQTLKEAAERRFASGEISCVRAYKEVLDRAGVDIYKLLVFSKDGQKLAEASAKLGALQDVAVSSSAKNNIEITHRHAQKGIALREFANRHHIALAETMAIGDNFNDLSMLTIAGVSVAMGNAEEAVKRACGFVARNNDKHGVAHAIRELVFLET
jgi:Cof subfamily protein (haloacid dehalogenase superfamily)